MTGWLMPLSEVADPVFASGSMGEGFAIDPLEGLVSAPCDGIVSAVAPTLHSVTLDPHQGGSLLIHVGLDSVALQGDGFELLVAPGAQVRAGDPLLRFGLNKVALGARSLMTPIVAIGEGDRLQIENAGRSVLRGERVGVAVPGQAAERPASGETACRRVVVPMPHGIHARPAAKIAEAAKLHGADIELQLAGRKASARSVVSLLKLAAKHGDELVINATGLGAPGAADAIAALIETGMGEGGEPASASSDPVPVAAAPGLAIGVATRLGRAELEVSEFGQNQEQEAEALRRALTKLSERLGSQRRGGPDIAAAHRGLVEDPELLSAAQAKIAEGKSAAHAWRAAVRAACDALDRTGEPLLQERVPDLLDVERQVIADLLGVELGTQTLPEHAIIIADDLLPSEFQALDQERLAGVALAGGGATSHVAVLAASAGIPMLVALGARAASVTDGATVILDAEAGQLEVDPDAAALAEAQRRLSLHRAARAEARARAGADARTRDGARIEVFANLGSVDDAARAVAEGAEGCGLLRTEFLFLDRDVAPSEDEQAGIYGRIAALLGDRPLIVRTFDIGGDKPVPYLPMAPEENPALGCRGVRLNLAQPDLLDTQLRAILRGVPAAQRRIMVPMVIERAELRAVRERLRTIEGELDIVEPTPLGVMIETPAAALLSESIAEGADFLSIGSNDLTQYALACDRGNPATAARLDSLHPAVLKLIAAAAQGARSQGRWLGVCGALASDPTATAILIGLGVTELSVAPGQIPMIKSGIATLEVERCRLLAGRALDCGSAAEVRALLKGEGCS